MTAVPRGSVEHLRKSDKTLRGVIDAIEADGGLGRRGRRPVAKGDHYAALLRSIIGQQLSVRVAHVMNERVLERYDGRYPTPEEVLAEDPEEFRAAIGLSNMKVAFMRSLAEHVIDGSLELDRMGKLSDEDVIAELVEVKGIGEWTAHMFLIFHLERPDVLPVGDLGVRSAIKTAYGLDELPGPTDMERIAEPWRPYRSVASRYLWRSLDNTPA
jgi:DNA-3-methyladenine glycosylase II